MWVLSASAAVVALDQLTKYFVRQNFALYESVSVLGTFFRLTYVENSGIVFGIGVGTALPLFTFLSLGATALILYFLYRERFSAFRLRLALAIVLGGAIGNAIDRILWSQVADFFDFGIGPYRFYIFNIADMAVTVGVGLYLLFEFLETRSTKAAADSSPAPELSQEA
ncbi:MAG: signal peptidase II [Candidatus Marinimicrobia bacterium]|nr:signal peptidase II [Candidatus Neomarinimicrobiota bacterium]